LNQSCSETPSKSFFNSIDPKQTITQFIDCSAKVEVGMISMVAN